MTLDALTDRVGELAEAVLADWRWVPDDLNVSVLGMLLYGLALETLLLERWQSGRLHRS